MYSYKYNCITRLCKNEIIPCLHSDSCNECKKKLLRNTLNNATKTIPIEIINMICLYINNDEEEKIKCLYCRKLFCKMCYSSYNTPWCCSCYLSY
jgi:hypothetical protein